MQRLRLFSRLYSSESVIVKNNGAVRTIAINRPRVRNAVNKKTALALHEAFTEFDKDDSAGVAIFCGNGGHFCSGYDLKELAGTEPAELLPVRFSPTAPAPMGPSRLMLSKPVIGCLTGYAVAGGLELALWCDLRVAESNVTLGFMNRRFGVPLIDGGTVRLLLLIGLSRALDLVLTGRTIDASEALAIGLINRIAPIGEGFQMAFELANHIASFPQKSMLNDRKSLLRSATNSDIMEHLEYEYNEGLKLLEEAKNGATMFTKGVGKSGSYNITTTK